MNLREMILAFFLLPFGGINAFETTIYNNDLGRVTEMSAAQSSKQQD